LLSNGEYTEKTGGDHAGAEEANGCNTINFHLSAFFVIYFM